MLAGIRQHICSPGHSRQPHAHARAHTHPQIPSVSEITLARTPRAGRAAEMAAVVRAMISILARVTQLGLAFAAAAACSSFFLRAHAERSRPAGETVFNKTERGGGEGSRKGGKEQVAWGREYGRALSSRLDLTSRVISFQVAPPRSRRHAAPFSSASAATRGSPQAPTLGRRFYRWSSRAPRRPATRPPHRDRPRPPAR